MSEDKGHRPIPNFDAGYDREAMDHLVEHLEARIARKAEEGNAARLIPGGAFVLDGADEYEPLWGDGEQIAWAEGESLWICGPQGVAKSTLMQNVALRRHGILDGDVLGWTVAQAERKGLYLAMDRPNQIKRSLRRMVGEEHREVLDANLTVWKGPPPQDVAKHPNTLIQLANEADAGTIYIDSLKDAAVGLSDDEVGSGFNRAVQTALAEGVEIIGAHHQRKGQQGGTKPKSLDDVYGSTWITSGSGSVILLWGKAGDVVMELEHLKPPSEPVGPLSVIVNFETGAVSIEDEVDLYDMARKAPFGIQAEGAARALFRCSDPERNQIEKARRKLKKHPQLEEVAGEAPPNGGKAPIYYRPIRHVGEAA